MSHTLQFVPAWRSIFVHPVFRTDIARTYRQPHGRIWLRILARGVEHASRLQRSRLNYSQITPRLAVGGAFGAPQVKVLSRYGVTAVVDCRGEACDPQALLADAGIAFLQLGTPDRHPLTLEQLRDGVDWVLDHLAGNGRVFVHCQHGVGRGPLMAAAVLVAQGHPAAEAVQLLRARRWQALPNDRQLQALSGFERDWRARRS